MHIPKTLFAGLARALESVSGRLDAAEIEAVVRHLVRGRPGFSPTLEHFAKAICAANAAPSTEFLHNGEAGLIERTAGFGFKTIFDVGANIGDWSLHAFDHHPAASVHAFEIAPPTFDILRQRLGTLANRVILNPFGLSDHDGAVDLNIDPANLYISSTHDFGYRGASKIKCKVRAGDGYASSCGIDRIDFVKIDVEGAESQVIHGLRSMFDAKAIRLVQFEYGRGAILSRFLLRDFYQFFTERHYLVGRLGPAGVTFRDYHFAHEDFNGPNYVACLQGDGSLIGAIAA